MGLNWEPKLVYKITSGLVIILILENLKNLGSQLFYAYPSKKKKKRLFYATIDRWQWWENKEVVSTYKE